MAAEETLNLLDEEAITNAMKKMEMSRGKSQRAQDLNPGKNSELIQSNTIAVIADDQRTHAASTPLAMQGAHVPNTLPAWEARGKSSQNKPGEDDGSRQQSLRREQPVMPERTVQSMELDLVPARWKEVPCLMLTRCHTQRQKREPFYREQGRAYPLVATKAQAHQVDNQPNKPLCRPTYPPPPPRGTNYAAYCSSDGRYNLHNR
jgi:hypothetical protein